MNNQRGTSTLLSIAIVLAVFVVGGGLVYWIANQQNQNNGPTVADVSRNYEEYKGKQLSLKGEMEDIKSPHLFKLDQEGTAAGDEIYVLSIPSVEPQGGASEDLNQLSGQDVLVQGTVRVLPGAEISKATGIDLDPQLIIELDQKPVLIARDVEYLPEN